MRKYWYYVFENKFRKGVRLCYSDSGEFELCSQMKYLEEIEHTICIITFWHEVSVYQYEEFEKKAKKLNV